MLKVRTAEDHQLLEAIHAELARDQVILFPTLDDDLSPVALQRFEDAGILTFDGGSGAYKIHPAEISAVIDPVNDRPAYSHCEMPPLSTHHKSQTRQKDAELLIRAAIESDDPDLVEKWLFAKAQELADLIKNKSRTCNRQTVMKTKFWREDRKRLREQWRRENT